MIFVQVQFSDDPMCPCCITTLRPDVRESRPSAVMRGIPWNSAAATWKASWGVTEVMDLDPQRRTFPLQDPNIQNHS